MITADEQDHEFFDILYQQWAKSTGAEKTYWMPEEVEPPSICETDHGLEDHVIWAVNQETQDKDLVASHLSEADADFICGLHGAIPDLIRRLHEAIDEATSKDEARDRAEANLAEAYLENQGLQERIRELESELSYWSNR
ncbi:Hypothetical Protein PBI_L5_39 [Fromanvirus L5]|uniref:Gene 39 protein n=1 Tax=Mycobacterium phage L5 TaxID=31757 RepID=VG39_BPML5|nr:Hypothetical Protein PBI_L5_39 [Fromanvirus L5]Q05249.1 RecName: Full=Gene 39 protein; AltName: Full=Gp39 [Fromanvirus L5]CAA79415.1 Hypothetical Protein PBI_L5_39 [Fromanvirus L5]